MNEPAPSRYPTLPRRSPEVQPAFLRPRPTVAQVLVSASSLVAVSLLLLATAGRGHLAFSILSIGTLVCVAELGLGMLVGNVLRSGRRAGTEAVPSAVPVPVTDSAARTRR